MLQLAEKYAKLLKTKVIDHRIHDNVITFVLESGQKLTMSTRQLEDKIAELTEREVGDVDRFDLPSKSPVSDEQEPEAKVSKPKTKKEK
jgi:hypothetical protein